MKELMLGFLLSLPMMANAVPVITFDEGSIIQTGVLQYDGAGGSLYGIDIDFNTSTGDATPLQTGAANALVCNDCLLNFETGANVLEGPGIWRWSPGGIFQVTGTLFQGLTEIASGVLLDGSFSNSPTVVGGGGNALFVSVGNVLANLDLVSYFGMPNNTYAFANTELALASCSPYGDPGGFNCDLQNADLALTSAVPTPGSLALFGSGLAAFGMFGMRQRKQS